jgi:hypothetical protein
MVKSLLLDLEKGTQPVLDLLRSHQVSSTVEYIRVEYWGDGNILVSDMELIAIFGIIGALPMLKELRIEFDELPLPAQALRSALSCRPARLRYLALEDVRLSGSFEDFEDAAEAVRRAPSLKTVRMYRCGPAQDTRATLDPIVVALSRIPTLKDVTLSNTHLSDEALGTLGDSSSLQILSLDHMSISAFPLGQLCQSSSIRELKFWGMPEINDDIPVMTSSLTTNNALKTLRMRYCYLNHEFGMRLSEMLYFNKSLENISLENMNWREFGRHLSKCLRFNTGLRSLSLSIDSKNITPSELQANAAAITGALENNSTLRTLRIFLRHANDMGVASAFADPVREMLQKNYTLENLYLNCSSSELSSEIDFLLKLNRTRKRHLLRNENSSREAFMDMLATHSQDVSLTHYFLTMNPSLFRIS